MSLTIEERRTLLSIARDVLARAAAGMERVSPELYAGAMSDPALARPAGVFVTLRGRGGSLRGCIGYIEGVSPLAQAVAENALAAATRDHRFPPVSEAEVAAIEVEISVLSPLEPLTSVEAIEVGRHGLLVSQGGRRGLLLPQVAAEHDLKPLPFLQETCRKAGLARDAYAHGAKVETFTAEVFGEEDEP